MILAMSPEEEAAQRRRDEMTDADMAVHEEMPKALYGSPAEAIKWMERRIEYLERSRAELHPEAGDEAEFRLIKDIAEARRRLADYKIQHDARN